MRIDDFNLDLDKLILRLKFFQSRIEDINCDSKQDIEGYKIELNEIINDLCDFQEKLENKNG